MKPSSPATPMKTTAYLIAATLSAPVAVLLGAPVALVACFAITAGLASIAFNDYGTTPTNYDRRPTTKTNERHPLAA